MIPSKQANLSAAEYKRLSERVAAAELRDAQRLERGAATEAVRKMVGTHQVGLHVFRGAYLNLCVCSQEGINRHQEADRFREYELQSKAAADRLKADSRSDWQTKKLATSFRTENWARMKQARDDKALQAELMANNKIQFEMSAHLQAERERATKAARHEMAQIRVDALRQKKLTQTFVEASQREALANDRLQAEMATQVRRLVCLPRVCLPARALTASLSCAPSCESAHHLSLVCA